MNEQMLAYLCDGDRSAEYPQLREIFTISDVIDDEIHLNCEPDMTEL